MSITHLDTSSDRWTILPLGPYSQSEHRIINLPIWNFQMFSNVFQRFPTFSNVSKLFQMFATSRAAQRTYQFLNAFKLI